MTAALLALVLAFPPPGFCTASDCPLQCLTFTAPADTVMDGTTRTVTSYEAWGVDDAGLRFPVLIRGDRQGGPIRPAEKWTPDSVFAISPPPYRTWNIRLWALDANGNKSRVPSNGVAIAQVGRNTPADSCCFLLLPMRRCAGDSVVCWKSDRPPGPITLWNGFASASLGVADSEAVEILSQSEMQRRVRDTVCGWPWQRAKGWPIAGKWEVCP